MSRYYKIFDGLGRHELERVAAEALENVEKSMKWNRLINDNLTNVQARSTELLLENRRLRAETLMPGFICKACGVFTGLAKEDHKVCRCCGAPRPGLEQSLDPPRPRIMMNTIAIPHADSFPRAELRDPAVTVRFMLAGRAHVTFQSEKTSTHYTYSIVRGDVRPWQAGTMAFHFVAVLTAPDHYDYLGTIFKRRTYRHGRKSRIAPSAPSAVAFAWVWSKLAGGHMPTTLAVYHEGRCGRCGRRLTTPESVTLGLGPECAQIGRASCRERV